MYVVPLAPEENCIIIFIDLILLMGWVDSTKFFCEFSEKLKDIANALIDAELPVPAYVAIVKTLTTRPPPPTHVRALPIFIVI